MQLALLGFADAHPRSGLKLRHQHATTPQLRVVPGAFCNESSLTWPELAEIIPYCRVHVSRLEKAGQFPKRLQLGPGRVAWDSGEVQEWLASRPRGPLPITRA